MRTLLLSSFVFAVLGVGFLGCGSSTQATDAAAGGAGGSAGAAGRDANGPELGLGGAPVPMDSGQAEAGPPVGVVVIDCTGLPADQCQDRIINPPALPEGVVPLPTEADPTQIYPGCTSL